ncbi:MAG: hypothetical protein E5Y60_05495 [Mesorhizobium sp.]|nr:MAG: hypothetical protein E5Y60_05495 [Mesorhizobium sp.]
MSAKPAVRTSIRAAAIGFLAGALSACVSTPPPPPQDQMSRTQVETAPADLQLLCDWQVRAFAVPFLRRSAKLRVPAREKRPCYDQFRSRFSWRSFLRQPLQIHARPAWPRSTRRCRPRRWPRPT